MSMRAENRSRWIGRELRCDGYTLRPGGEGFVEIVFDAKPDEATRAELKLARYWWCRRGWWYGFETMLPETYCAAAERAMAEGDNGDAEAIDALFAFAG
jgi:hypothetical protein